MNEKAQKDKFYHHTKFGDVAHQSIMPILAIADGEIIPLGTAFVVMPNGLLMTAKHVIEEFLSPNPKRRDGNGHYKNTALYAFHVADNDGEIHGGLWRIIKAHHAVESDVAFCCLEGKLKNKSPYVLPVATLSPGRPAVGSRIAGFGYHTSSSFFSEETIAGKKVVEYSRETSITEGTIIELKETEGFRKFPHFRSDARFEPGMSGGPVFNERGGVCGVICSSLTGCTDESGYISYVSLLWPAIGITIETAFEEGGEMESVTVMDLIQRNFISSDETIEKIEVIVTETGKQVKYKKD